MYIKAKLKQFPPVYTCKWVSATDEEIEEELLKGKTFTYHFRVPNAHNRGEG